MEVSRRTFLMMAAASSAFLSVGARANEAFPVEIEHGWGTTRIEKTPRRVVSLSYIGGDFLLALGIKPVAIRYWYGGNDQGVWPWAEDALGEAEPVLLRGEVDVEQVALLKPDLIEALWSGITRDEYDRLSAIAPVLAPTQERGAYGTPWDEITKTIGRAVGKQVEAARIVAKLQGRMEDIREDHPDWQGRTAAIGWPGGPGMYVGGDVRADLLKNLGFVIPQRLKDIARGSFYVTVSPELTDPYDADVLVWLDTGALAGQIKAMPLRHTMRAHAEGREIVADAMLSGAMSFSSPLSLDYALDRLLPLLEAAVDGDPGTVVESSREAGILQ